MPDESGQELTPQNQEPGRRKSDFENIPELTPQVNLKSVLSLSRTETEEKSPEQIIEQQRSVIENLQKQVEQLAEAARIDQQTGLLNKNAFIADLYPALTKAFREHKQVGLLSLDLQGLKKINDTAGHEAGDELIAKFGDAVKKVTSERLRKTDGGYRVGGDEVIILLYDTDPEGLEKAAEDYRTLFDQEQINTGIGGGIIDTTDWNSMQASMGTIDEKLYESKKEAYDTGRNNIKLLNAA